VKIAGAEPGFRRRALERDRPSVVSGGSATTSPASGSADRWHRPSREDETGAAGPPLDSEPEP